MKNDVKRTCSICFLAYEGFGNNAWPINDGFCCDKCNETVLQVRLRKIADRYVAAAKNRKGRRDQ